MDIFISWSGQLSRSIATVLHDFIPNIIQQAVPFLSPEDIKKGKRWSIEIGDKLKNSNFGIICLTPDNFREPWILFEAGALSKQFVDSSVCTILFDTLDASALLESPLSQFQHTMFNKADFHKLFQNINERLGNNKLKENLLENSFKTYWPKLEKKISDILTKEINKSNPAINFVIDEKPMDKLLRMTEYISASVARLGLPRDSFDFAKFTNSNELTYLGETFNHPVRVRIFPFLKNGKHKIFTMTNQGERIDDYERDNYPFRGVSIELLFYQEVDIFFSITFSFHKGQTFFETNQHPEISNKEKEQLTFNPIWRD